MMTLTTKSNGDEITSSWFNDIKTEIEELDTDVTTRITAHEDDTTPHATISAASIEAPSRLDAKQDTEANLTTYASTAANGQMCFATDTKKMYQVVDSALAEVGGGGAGDLHTYETFVADDDLYTDWDATGLSNATFGEESSAPLDGDVSYLLTNVTGSVNEFLYSPNVAVPLRARGKANGIEFPFSYDGDDADITVQVYDITNTVLLESAVDIEASSNGTMSISTYIPSDCVSLKLKIVVAVENNGKEFIFDNINFTDGMVAVDLMTEYDVVEKYLASNVTTNIALTDLTLSDLVIGEKYTLTLYGAFYGSSTTTDNVDIIVTHTGQLMPFLESSIASLSSAKTKSLTHDFTATATTITFATGSISSPSRVDGDGTVRKTHVQLIRKPTESEHVVHPVSSETWMVTESYRAALVAGIATGSAPYFTTTHENSISELGVITNDGTSGWSFTANKDVSISAHFCVGSPHGSTASYDARILIEGTYVGRAYDTGLGYADDGSGATSSFTGKVLAGETVKLYLTGNYTANDGRLSFEARAARPINSIIVSPVTRTAYIKDVKASGTQGGTFTSGAWRTRTLNTVSGDTGIVSLSSNQFTLAPGKYNIEASAPAMSVQTHQVKLVSDPSGTPADAIIGTSSYTVDSDTSVTRSLLEGQLAITTTTDFELQHQCLITRADYGFGVKSNFSVDEIYAQVKITKVS